MPSSTVSRVLYVSFSFHESRSRHLNFAFVGVSRDLLHLLDERRCLDIGSAHRVWLLPRLQQLEVEVTENEVELLIPLVSARLASPDAANIRTVHLQVLNQDLCYGESEDDASSHLNSLRLLVPEVVYEKLPPRD